MSFTYLITQTEFRSEISALNYNIELERVAQHFINVQRLKVREMLGGDFYDQLVAQKAANNLTPDNQKFRLDYLVPYMAYQILYEYAEQSFAQIGNTGAQKFTGTNTQPADTSYVTAIKRQAGENANAYATAATKFLSENPTKYPLWRGACANNQKPYNFGIYIAPEYKR